MKKTIKNVVFTFLILSSGISFVQATGEDPDKINPYANNVEATRVGVKLICNHCYLFLVTYACSALSVSDSGTLLKAKTYVIF